MKSLQVLMKKFEPGHKVKVHAKNTSYYGEVLGVDENGKILLASRPSFKDLPLGAFDHFEVWSNVKFVYHKPTITWQCSSLNKLLK